MKHLALQPTPIAQTDLALIQPKPDPHYHHAWFLKKKLSSAQQRLFIGGKLLIF